MARNQSPSPAENLPLGHSATSPQPLLSKRDKRRNQLVDKLQEMIALFSDNRDSHYRAQLAALQADINLISKADPLANKPLEDNGLEAAELVAQIMGNNVPAAPSAGTDYAAQVGKFYAQFVEAVNDAMEERDYTLTMLWNKHESTKAEIERTYAYKAHIAEEEHKWLAATIRERLTSSIQRKCDRLKKEKEQLDLSDSNAMLMHPNQFSIANPASPGGPQAPRKTRNRGNKFADNDDLGTGTDNKRKRKLFEENDNDSPGPSARAVELGVGSPFREAKARTIHAQFEAPAYSLERIFTEKELSHAMNQAAYAASAFFAKQKDPDSATQGATTNGVNGVNPESENAENGDGTENRDDDSPPGPAEMTRQVSSNPHATRGATRSALGPGALTARPFPFGVPAPVILPANIGSKPNASATPPIALTATEIDQDMQLMMRDMPVDDATNEKFLSVAVADRRTREFELQPPGAQPPVSDITSIVRSMAPHLEIGAVGGVPMSAQSSMAGYSDTGANTPAQGGVGMRREASGSGRRGGRGRAA